MYVSKRQVTMQSGIATLTAIALVLWAFGAHMFTVAEAVNLTYVKDTLSDSDTGSASNHTFEFKSPTGVTSGQSIVITFPNGFNISTSSVVVGDVDMTVAGVEQDLVASGATASQWNVAAPVGQTLTLVSGGASAVAAANATVTIEIGTHATQGSTGTHQVTNPMQIQSYEFTIAAGTADTGQGRVAIVDNVLVTANVDTTLTFVVTGVANGQSINITSPTSTATTTTSTALPFEKLSPNVSKTLAQDLSVATNAIHGYVVTVMQDQNLLSSTGADIDGFIDGGYNNTPTGWIQPTPSILLENTWGHWGITSDDIDLHGAGPNFAADQYVAASTTPRAIMAHTGPADGTTDNIGLARIGYQAQITALQEAGDDYNTTLTYVATPTF